MRKRERLGGINTQEAKTQVKEKHIDREGIREEEEGY